MNLGDLIVRLYAMYLDVTGDEDLAAVLTARDANDLLEVGDLRSLSEAAQAARAPRPPGELVDAMTDRVHRDVGTGRGARTKGREGV